jgi:ATP-dependent RNA helicase DDX21
VSLIIIFILNFSKGTKFKRVGAPSSADIVEASTTDAVRSLDTVADELVEKFRSGAEEILKNREAVSALAAALAVISGCTKVTQRSLLTSKENMTTYLLCKTDEEIRGKSFVYVIMKNMIGEDKAESAIQRICFTKDRKGLVFDVASEYDDLIQEKWYNTKALELKVLKELPELEEEKGGFGGFSGGGGGGRFGNRQGGGGGGGRFGNRQGGGRSGGFGGGFGGGRGGRGGSFGASRNGSGGDDSNKRKFDRVAASNSATNKRIKFD